MEAGAVPQAVDSNGGLFGPWSRVWALVWIGSPSKLKSSMFLQLVVNSRTVPFMRRWLRRCVSAEVRGLQLMCNLRFGV